TSPEGKEYRRNRETATLLVRPRGWHLPEKHVIIDRVPISGSLMDFGLYFFHNAKELRTRGTGPYFYLPKMESHLEARLWNEVFRFWEEALGIPSGSVKATARTDTIPAASEAGPSYRRHGRVQTMVKGSRGERDRDGEGAGGQYSGVERRL